MTTKPVPQKKKADAYRRGVMTFLILAVLTVVELWASTATAGSAPILFIIALAKAGLIVWYFMHIASLWMEEGH